MLASVTNNAKGREPADKLLERGVANLAEVLGPAGFEFIMTDDGASNGGSFASGEFLRGDRRLELQVRSSLSLVATTSATSRWHTRTSSAAFARWTESPRRGSTRVSPTIRWPGFATSDTMSIDLRPSSSAAVRRPSGR